MDTTHARTTIDPMNMVAVDPRSDTIDLAGWTGTCQAVTRDYRPCTHRAVGRKAGIGPRIATRVLLCSTHLHSRYIVDAIAR